MITENLSAMVPCFYGNNDKNCATFPEILKKKTAFASVEFKAKERGKRHPATSRVRALNSVSICQ